MDRTKKVLDLLDLANHPLAKALAQGTPAERLVELAGRFQPGELAKDLGRLKAGDDKREVLLGIVARLRAAGVTDDWLRDHLPSADELRAMQDDVAGDVTGIVDLLRRAEGLLE